MMMIFPSGDNVTRGTLVWQLRPLPCLGQSAQPPQARPLAPKELVQPSALGALSRFPGSLSIPTAAGLGSRGLDRRRADIPERRGRGLQLLPEFELGQLAVAALQEIPTVQGPSSRHVQ